VTRLIAFALLAAGVASAAAAQGQLPVAPPPREIRPDGSRDPAPAGGTAKRENPLDVVERIIKNSNEVGDKLAMTDTGGTTREKQKKILQDIDALLKQDDPPPDKNQDKQDQKDKQDEQDQKDKKDNKQDKSDKSDKKDDMMPNGGMGDMPPMKKDGMGGGGGMDQQPMGGDQITDRQPRKGGGQKQEPKEGRPKGGGQKQQPMGGKQPMQPPKDPKTGKTPDPTPGMPVPGQPLLPHEEEVVKDVWGHLPDKLRQQATQYYKQDFMPRYTELLKHYYSSVRDAQQK
jgi:hypothetical protein